MLPLPVGVVIGRVNLAEVSAAADTAQQQALQSALDALQLGGATEEAAIAAASSSDVDADTGGIVSLNTTGERGIRFEVGCGLCRGVLLHTPLCACLVPCYLTHTACIKCQEDCFTVAAGSRR